MIRIARRVTVPDAPGTDDDYSNFVEHHRFGRAPRYTDLQLKPVSECYALTVYHSEGAIPGTAVRATPDRQRAAVPVLYYFDLKRTCYECGRPFLFFAEEQKHWYETLELPLSANCVRCVVCRQARQELRRELARYEELVKRAPEWTPAELTELVELALELIETGEFSRKLIPKIRHWLNRLDRLQLESTPAGTDLRRRLEKLERNSGRRH